MKNIFALTSNFLADIPTGDLIPLSPSTTKLSGITFNISLFGKFIPFFAISRTLSISFPSISSQDIEIIHLLSITSNEEELKEMKAQYTFSHAIFSASSRDLSKFALNSSISNMFHFLIAFD
jgi:hypothetical protein